MKLELLKHQHEFVRTFYSDPLKWAIAIVSGFGGGKSYTLASTANIGLINYRCNIGVYSVTYDLLKLVNIPQIMEMLNSFGLKHTLNKQDMIITVKGVGQIIFRSLDNPARIIGYETGIALVDELDTLPFQKALSAWNMVIARNRQPLQGGFRNKVGVFTTPEGYNFVHNKWVKNPSDGYHLIRAKTTDNKYLPPEYVENLRETYPDNLIEAYLNGEFVNLNGKQVYYSFNRDEQHTDFDYSLLGEVDSNVVNFG